VHIESLFPPFGLLDYIFCGITALLLVLSWVHHIGVFSKVKLTPNTESSFREPVSIVIAARNELQNLQQNLPLWLDQDYPLYEIVIADDGSTDGSADWIVSQLATEPRLKFVLLDPEYVKMHGKKIALTLAFKKSAHQYFVLTDADCKPASDQWLRGMTEGFAKGKDIVLGYSPYEKRGGFLNALIRYETILTALHYFGYAIKGKPYMGVGRNLAYSRKVYDHNHGFASHSHLPAGDDDLFVQSAAHATNTAVCIQKNAFMVSTPKNTFSSWWRQKRRHLWVGKFYSGEVRRMLAVYPVVQILFLMLIVTWIFFAVQWWYPLVILCLKFIPEWYIKGRKAKLLDGADLVPWLPILSLFNLFFYGISGIGAFFAKKPKW
jgi:biofilm PGA synthesis N-glycosyltransferase PgaC